MGPTKICCVRNCRNSDLTHPEKSYFKFPLDSVLCAKWLENCGRKDITPLEAGSHKTNYRVCEDHFEIYCFKTFTKRSFRKDIKVIPTIFNTSTGPRFKLNSAPGVESDVEEDLSSDVKDQASVVECDIEQPSASVHQQPSGNVPQQHSGLEDSPNVQVDLPPKTGVEEDPAEYYECVLDPQELMTKTDKFPLSYNNSSYLQPKTFNAQSLAQALLQLNPNVEAYRLDDLCCFCLDKLGYDFINVFDEHSKDSREIRRMCAVALPPAMNLNICDGVPQNICRSCVEDVRKCHRIVAKFLRVNSYLRNVAKYSIFVEDESLNHLEEEKQLMEMQKEQRLARVMPSSALVVPLPVIEQTQDDSESESETMSVAESDVEQDVVDNDLDSDDNGEKFSEEELPDINQEESQPELDLHANVLEVANIDPNVITYDCGICHKPFSSFASLHEHRNREHQNVKYKCDQCPDKYFEEKTDFDSHMVETHKVECKYCQKTFFSKLQLENHIHKLHEKSYKCRFCERRFAQIGLRIQHEKKEHDSAPEVCWVCGRMVKNLQNHLKVHDTAKLGKFTCRHCPELFNSVKERNLHRLDVHFPDRKFECEECGERFMGELQLQDHRELKHSEPEAVNYMCDKCAGGFKTKQSYESHKRRLERTGVCGPQAGREMMIYQPDEIIKSRRQSGNKYLRRDKVCDVCGRKFFLKTVMKRHRKYHFANGNREVLDTVLNEPEFYTCEDCGKRVYSKTMMMAHRATHTGDTRPFHCEFCGKKFPKLLQIIVHYRLHTGEKLDQCRFCNKKYPTKPLLKQHEKSHTKVKWLKCDRCGRAFLKKKVFENHMLKCNGKERKYYPCWACERKFMTSKGRRLHEKAHHPQPTVEEPQVTDEEAKERKYYPCWACERKFMTSKGRRQHEKAHHPQPTVEEQQVTDGEQLETYIQIPDENGEFVTININGLAFMTEQA